MGSVGSTSFEPTASVWPVKTKPVMPSMAGPNFLLQIIPHVDGTPRICELVEYHLGDIVIKGAWTAPGALSLVPRALAPVAESWKSSQRNTLSFGEDGARGTQRVEPRRRHSGLQIFAEPVQRVLPGFLGRRFV